MEEISGKEIELTDPQKIQILLHSLGQRYSAIETIRARVQNLSLWLLGLFVTAIGWLIQSNTNLTTAKKIYFSLVVLISILIIRIFYLEDLKKGFKVQQKTQAKIEKALKLFEPGVYGPGAIHPSGWEKAGEKGGGGKFFYNSFLLIYTATALMIISIWLK